MLCLAADLGSGLPFEHGLHSTLFVMRLADRLGADSEVAAQAYYECLLFYIGCTVDAEITAELFDEGELLRHFSPAMFGDTDADHGRHHARPGRLVGCAAGARPQGRHPAPESRARSLPPPRRVVRGRADVERAPRRASCGARPRRVPAHRGGALGTAAHVLGQQAGIPDTDTVHGLLARLEHTSFQLPAAAVIVPAEAAMCDTRTYLRLVRAADAAGVKVVPVGDDRQAPCADAGGTAGRAQPPRGRDRARGQPRFENLAQRDAAEQLRDRKAPPPSPNWVSWGWWPSSARYATPTRRSSATGWS